MDAVQLKSFLASASVEALATLLVALAFGWRNEEEVVEERPESALDLAASRHGDPNTLTVKQLRAIACGMGVKSYWLMRKCELVAALARHEVVETDPEEYCGVKLSSDRDVEYVVGRYPVYTTDDHGFMVYDGMREVISDTSSLTDPWFSTRGNQGTQGWAGLDPWLPAPAERPIDDCVDAQVSWDKTGAGFLPEEVCDLDDEVFTSTSWNWGKKAHSEYSRWMRGIRACSGDTSRLQHGWKLFWKQFFASRDAGKPFLSPVQVRNIRSAFQSEGITSNKQAAGGL